MQLCSLHERHFARVAIGNTDFPITDPAASRSHGSVHLCAWHRFARGIVIHGWCSRLDNRSSREMAIRYDRSVLQNAAVSVAWQKETNHGLLRRLSSPRTRPV